MSDRAALITALILDRPMCVPCITAKSGLGAAEVEATLTVMRTGLQIHRGTGRCLTCGTITPALSVNRPSRVPPPHDRALWEFLERQRGEMFCSSCLAKALGVTGRLDRALMVAEGRGARRQHGACKGCGKDRLLCGLAALNGNRPPATQG